MERMAERAAIDRWLDRERDAWSQSFDTALGEAILHLQGLIFEEGWDRIVADAGSQEAALRESVLHYERGLANLFSFVRASGSLADAVAWSIVKTRRRRAALESGLEITLRTALETGLYMAERTPLGDHAIYTAWVRSLLLFLRQITRGAPEHPGPGASWEARLEWAYGVLAPLEDQHVFHEQFSVFLRDAPVATISSDLLGASPDAILQHEAALLPHPRFDLLLNTALIWLGDAGGRLEYFTVVQEEWSSHGMG